MYARKYVRFRPESCVSQLVLWMPQYSHTVSMFFLSPMGCRSPPWLSQLSHV